MTFVMQSIMCYIMHNNMPWMFIAHQDTWSIKICNSSMVGYIATKSYRSIVQALRFLYSALQAQ